MLYSLHIDLLRKKGSCQTWIPTESTEITATRCKTQKRRRSKKKKHTTKLPNAHTYFCIKWATLNVERKKNISNHHLFRHICWPFDSKSNIEQKRFSLFLSLVSFHSTSLRLFHTHSPSICVTFAFGLEKFCALLLPTAAVHIQRVSCRIVCTMCNLCCCCWYKSILFGTPKMKQVRRKQHTHKHTHFIGSPNWFPHIILNEKERKSAHTKHIQQTIYIYLYDRNTKDKESELEQNPRTFKWEKRKSVHDTEIGKTKSKKNQNEEEKKRVYYKKWV